jgi:hypothetical protein
VTIVGSTGPVDNALVRLEFSPEVQPLDCWCAGQTHPAIDAVTNASGVATFFIAGGGCFDPAHFTNPPVSVYANGILMAEVGMVSPDMVDGAGNPPWTPWSLSASCTSGLTDAVAHTAPIKSGAYSYCSDLNTDGTVSVLDAVLLTPSVKTGAACAR